MPIQMDFSKSRETLGRIQQFLQYDMMQKRASERQEKQAYLENALSTNLSREKFGQDVALEGYRSSNTMKEAQNAAVLAIAQQPQWDAMISFLNLGRMGKLGPEHQDMFQYAEKYLKDSIGMLSESAYKVSTGEATPKHFASLLQNLGTKSAQWSSTELGTNLRAKEQIRISDEVNRINAMKESNVLPKQVENEITMIDKNFAFIQSQRQDMPDKMKSRIASVMGDAGISMPATLPSNIQGMVLEGLSDIRQKINREKRLMTSEESKFVNEAVNSWKLRGTVEMGEKVKPYDASSYTPGAPDSRPGNVLNPDTGERGTDKDLYEADAQRAKIATIKKKTMDLFNRPLVIQEYEEYKVLAEMVKNREPMNADQKLKYNDYERRLWWHPTEEEEAYYLGLATEHYNNEFLRKGETPAPYPPGYNPQDMNKLIKTPRE